MDRSFLSDQDIIAATRDFVCLRASTYESAEEAPFLASLFRGRSGELENTVFALVEPDGKTRIGRGGRSPGMALGRSKEDILRGLERTAKRFKVKNTEPPATLPLAENVRLAVNVAACDNQPLVIILAEEEPLRARIEKALAPLAWSEEFLGQFHYVSSSNATELAGIAGVAIPAGMLVIEPDRFGTGGKVIASHAVGDASRGIAETLRAALAAFDRKASGDRRDHYREGSREGVNWETAIPVTDPGPGRAREGGPRPPR